MEDATKSKWIVGALNQYESHLVRYAAFILGDIERAREVVQETFMRLCKEKEESVNSHLAQWLFTVCRNLAFDVRKKENRMSAMGERDISNFELRNSNLGPDGLEQQETMGHVLRIMETLPSNQREVLRLKFQHELSYREISEITKLSVTNVGFLIHTAIKTLRKELLTESPKRRMQ